MTDQIQGIMDLFGMSVNFKWVQTMILNLVKLHPCTLYSPVSLTYKRTCDLRLRDEICHIDSKGNCLDHAIGECPDCEVGNIVREEKIGGAFNFQRANVGDLILVRYRGMANYREIKASIWRTRKMQKDVKNFLYSCGTVPNNQLFWEILFDIFACLSDTTISEEKIKNGIDFICSWNFEFIPPEGELLQVPTIGEKFFEPTKVTTFLYWGGRTQCAPAKSIEFCLQGRDNNNFVATTAHSLEEFQAVNPWMARLEADEFRSRFSPSV